MPNSNNPGPQHIVGQRELLEVDLWNDRLLCAHTKAQPNQETGQGRAPARPWMRPFAFLTLTAIAVSHLHAANADWLLDPAPYRASVTTNRSGVVLENGLVRRVIQLAPNAATVAYENLMTGEPVIRSVRPEAIVELDGVRYDIGGLVGQPIHNYLDPAWLGRLEADPTAFRFTGFTVGKTRERFPWKKRSEWMPQDLPWPPPGVSLTLEFAAPENFGQAARPAPVLLADDFTRLEPEWKVMLSTRNDRTFFHTRGNSGEIMAQANDHAFVERAWPVDSRSVQCLVDPGTDQSASWGPGLALVFAEGVVKFNLRPGKTNFGIAWKGSETEHGKLTPGRPYTLRMTLESGRVICDAAVEGRAWQKVGEVRITGIPTAVRIGKMDKQGGAGDFAESGDLGTCRVSRFRILGKPEPAAANSGGKSVVAEVHYELFDGIPLLSKWLVVRNASTGPVRLNHFVCEILAAVETESIVDDSPTWQLPNLMVETDYTFGGMSGPNHSAGVHWVPDPLYTSQVNYNLQTPCLLECRPSHGPDVTIPPGECFESFRAFELLPDSTHRERRTLGWRRMYRTVAPWVTENPVLMHVRSAQPAAVRQAIDQCAEVGFEMVVLTFGSGFNFESRDPDYQARLKELADYGRSKGIALGGYSLLASRGAATAADDTQGVPARFGVMPCLGATWGSNYLAQLQHFMEFAGLGVLEHDGSYPGDWCAATNHPYHRGLADSQWVQWKAITSLYQWCRGKGVYLNIPDWYFLNGGTKTGMGYREVNWSLPREYQEIIERQNIFDGTWEKTPGMGWMFVPLTEYHGGGASATIEPLKDHLAHYEQRLANLFGAGVIACYRGPRLYDSDETKAVVKRWVDFYKSHRAILNSDIVHLRRADGRDLDYLLHVNPALKERGLLMVYNPLAREVTRTLRVPLYYTGLSDIAAVREREGEARAFSLDRGFSIALPVRVPARGVTWFVME